MFVCLDPDKLSQDVTLSEAAVACMYRYHTPVRKQTDAPGLWDVERSPDKLSKDPTLSETAAVT